MKIRATFDRDEPPVASAPQAKARARHDGVSPAARNLALAHRIEGLIGQGLIADYAAAARLLGVSQPRLTHLMGLLLLAPEIQAAILAGTIAPGDKQLRQLARVPEWSGQLDLLARFHADSRPRRRIAATTTSPAA